MKDQTREGLRELAQAMRKGVAVFPHQVTGQLFLRSWCDGDWSDNVDGCCALGHSLVGKFPNQPGQEYLAMRHHFKNNNQVLALFGIEPADVRDVVLPIDWGRTEIYNLDTAIVILNDREKWKTEAIADWLETLANGTD